MFMYDFGVAPRVFAKFEEEANGRPWTAFVPTRSREVKGFRSPERDPAHPAVRPDEERSERAITLVRRLNRELPYMGYWVVVWFGAEEMGMAWADGDHDIQFWVMNDQPFVRMVKMTIEDHLKHAETAWEQWFMIKNKLIGVKPEQQHKAALGERPKVLN